jgi:hypothetical protein
MNRTSMQDFISDFARKWKLGLGWASIYQIITPSRTCMLSVCGHKMSVVTFVEYNDFEFLEYQVLFQIKLLSIKYPEILTKAPFAQIQIPDPVRYRLIAVSSKSASNINSYLYTGLVIVPSAPLLDCIINYTIVEDTADRLIVDHHQASLTGNRVMRISSRYMFDASGCTKSAIESATWMRLINDPRDFYMIHSNRDIWEFINQSRKPRYDGFSVLIDTENRIYYESNGEWHKYLVHAIDKVELPSHVINELQMKNMMEVLQ